LRDLILKIIQAPSPTTNCTFSGALLAMGLH
jgi:hypothetical protein